MTGARPTGPPRPSWRNRLAARRHQEVPVTELEAFRRAGSGVYELSLLVEQRRRELSAQGRHPWECDASTSSLLVATWNARSLQTLGAELLDSDRREDPGTAGFVPLVTYRQAWSFFQPVAGWMALARRAAASPDVCAGEEVELPAALPPLLGLRSGPRKHQRGMLNAGDALSALVEQELGAVLGAGPPPARYASVLQRVEELAAQARSGLQYAQGLWHPASTRELETVIVRHLHPALVLEHHLGQFLALPELAVRYRTGWRTPD